MCICTLQWYYNECHGISNHRFLHCLLNRLFRHRSKETSKLRVTGLCEGNPLVTSGFPLQKSSNAENVSIWWRHHDFGMCYYLTEQRLILLDNTLSKIGLQFTKFILIYVILEHINGLVQDCSISSALAMELLSLALSHQYWWIIFLSLRWLIVISNN